MSPEDTMKAMVTMRHGGLDAMEWKTDWPRPTPAAGEVLLRVRACGLNNTDVNTRSGWYSKSVTGATSDDNQNKPSDADPTWGAKPIAFPRIQGADICGEITAVGAGVDPARVGERVISDNWLRDREDTNNINKTGFFGSERDGGFAEFTTLPAVNAVPVNSSLSDAEMATFSCSYSTAEGMLTRADVTDADTVLVTGASGGVGGALIQLAKRRGARVVAMASAAKQADVAKLGADLVIERTPEDLRGALNGARINVLADIVGGPCWSTLIDVIERGGRYVCSGAIAGPMVDLDLRTLYLRDLTFFGSTVLPPDVTKSIVRYIEAGEIKPALAATFALKDLHEAQAAFMAKKHTGNIVVIT